MKNNPLPITEDLDFHYLLTLMPALRGISGFEWLPELYSIVGYETVIKLCEYCGGETIQIPTIDQLSESITALQWYYDVFISGKLKVTDIPDECKELVYRIRSVFNARKSET